MCRFAVRLSRRVALTATTDSSAPPGCLNPRDAAREQVEELVHVRRAQRGTASSTSTSWAPIAGNTMCRPSSTRPSAAEFLTPVCGSPQAHHRRNQAWFEYASQMGELLNTLGLCYRPCRSHSLARHGAPRSAVGPAHRSRAAFRYPELLRAGRNGPPHHHRDRRLQPED